MAIVCLHADNPEQVLGELGASDAPFDSWYGTEMRTLFGLDLARLELVGSGELLFAWGEDVPGEHEAPKKDNGERESR